MPSLRWLTWTGTAVHHSTPQSTRLGLLVNNIRKKTTDKALARRLKNLVRSWKEACTAPAQSKLSLPHSATPVGEPSAGVVRPPSVGPTPSVNSHNAQPAAETNRHAVPLSSTLNSQTDSLTHSSYSFPQLSVAEIEASVSQSQFPALHPSGVEPESQAHRSPEQECTPPLPPSTLSRGVLQSLTVCIPLSPLPIPLVDKLKRPKERQPGSHVAIAQEPPPSPCEVALPPNTVVLPPHLVVFPLRSVSPHPHPLAPSPIPPSQPTHNLVVNIPLHKVSVGGAVHKPALENGSSGSPCREVGGDTASHTPSVLPEQLGFVPAVGEESSLALGQQQQSSEMHTEENSVVCWRYVWTGEGRYSGIHGYFDHMGQWHDWTMPLPSHKDSVQVLPYVYID